MENQNKVDKSRKKTAVFWMMLFILSAILAIAF